MSLSVESRITNYYFTEKEKKEKIDKALQLEKEVENMESELSSLMKLRKAAIAETRAKIQGLKIKYEQGFEERTKYVYLRKDYANRLNLYIDPTTCQIIETEPFSPRDEMRQLRLGLDAFSEKVREKLDEATVFFSDTVLKDIEETKVNLIEKKVNLIEKDEFYLTDTLLAEELFKIFSSIEKTVFHVSKIIKAFSDSGYLDVEEEFSFDDAFDKYSEIYLKFIKEHLGVDGDSPASTEQPNEPTGNLAFPLDLPENPQTDGEAEKKPKKKKGNDGENK